MTNNNNNANNNGNLSFLQKEKLFTGIGENIEAATNAEEALEMAGLNWHVGQRKLFMYTPDGDLEEVKGAVANVREEDGKMLGTVTPRYKEVQNQQAFAFTEDLLGAGVQYVRGGSFRGGRSVWLMAKMPENKIILGDPVEQYLVFTNSHDGTGAVRVMIAPRRIVCSNALNFFVRSATRKWSCSHMGNIEEKMIEATNTLTRTEAYMTALDGECERLQAEVISAARANEIIRDLMPYPKDMTDRQKKRVDDMRLQLSDVYFHKEDLTHLGHTAYRMVNAVSDYATHAAPSRMTKEYASNLWEKTVNGHPMVDAVTKIFAA